MKRLLLFMGLVLPFVTSHAQSPYSFSWKGFVNPHYYADSRSVVGGREDMMLFYPKPIVYDSLGNDINDGWQGNMLAITARLGLLVKGPDALGAKTSAYIEGDFTGSTNATINDLRLRHAYIKLDWTGNSESGNSTSTHGLIVGQYWYPMVVHEIMPMTNPLNMGAPFHCYSRQPQIRYNFVSHGIEVVAVASWQLDNMSQGELNNTFTSSTAFARHSMVPELNAQLRYNSKHFLLGGAVNAKTIQPQIPHTTVDSRLHTSLTYSLYGKYSSKHLNIKAQTLLNNSLYEGCSLGGYMFIGNLFDEKKTVMDWYFNTYWIDLEMPFGKWKPGVFLGYARQNGWIINATQTVSHTFGRGADIETLWRVQPRLTYRFNEALFCTAEAEYTHADYFDATNAAKTTPVGNLRLSLTLQYDF